MKKSKELYNGAEQNRTAHVRARISDLPLGIDLRYNELRTLGQR